MKFGGGVAGAVIGFVMSAYGYDGQDESTIAGAIPGIKMLMSWLPGVFIAASSLVMLIYPLSTEKMLKIKQDLKTARTN